MLLLPTQKAGRFSLLREAGACVRGTPSALRVSLLATTRGLREEYPLLSGTKDSIQRQLLRAIPFKSETTAEKSLLFCTNNNPDGSVRLIV